mmetsp:Transcript_38808/g.89612  ORF Transcript_38808/g.89612 Transcript_38808/m.89612 type:complete len:215 (-) Transcript_38808:694-1338(-)
MEKLDRQELLGPYRQGSHRHHLDKLARACESAHGGCGPFHGVLLPSDGKWLRYQSRHLQQHLVAHSSHSFQRLQCHRHTGEHHNRKRTRMDHKHNHTAHLRVVRIGSHTAHLQLLQQPIDRPEKKQLLLASLPENRQLLLAILPEIQPLANPWHRQLQRLRLLQAQERRLELELELLVPWQFQGQESDQSALGRVCLYAFASSPGSHHGYRLQS